MEYTEERVTVHTEQYEEHRPAQRGAPGGVDYFTVVYQRFTIGGRVYERQATWRGPEPGFRHVVVSSHQYPASKSPLNLPTEETEDKPMKDWTKMSAGDFYTDGVQMDLLTDAIGDGVGTIPMDLAPAETAPADEGRADGTLFGLALDVAPATDGALFSVIAA